MPTNYQDYLLQTIGRGGVYIQAINNDTAAVFITTNRTSPQGLYTFTQSIPPGNYTLYYSATLLAPNDPAWIPTGDTHYPVPVTTVTDLTSMAVTQVVAGTNVQVSPGSGLGVVTISATSGGGGVPVDTTVGDYRAVGAANAAPGITTQAAGPDHVHQGVHSIVAGTGITISGTTDITVNAPGAGIPVDTTTGDYQLVGVTTIAPAITNQSAGPDHVHGHGSGYLANSHHNQAHDDTDHTGANRMTTGVVAGAGTIYAPAVTNPRKGVAFVKNAGSISSITADDSTNNKVDVTLETFVALMRPTAAVQEGPLALSQCTSAAQALQSSGLADYFLVYFPVGRVLNSITFLAGTTGSTGLTHSWAALYQTSGALIAQCTDITTPEWAASTFRTFNFGVAQTIATAGLYYIALSVTAPTTMPLFNALAMTTGASKNGPASGWHFADTTHTVLAGTATANFTFSATNQNGYWYWYVS
jgi:hypothetical protein